MAATLIGALPVTLPIPWAGFALLVIVMSVSALPLLYGKLYVRDVPGFRRREASNSGSDGDAGNTCTYSADNAHDMRLDEGLAGGEACPLLGAVDRTGVISVEDLDSYSLTWKQCLQVL